MEAIYSVKTTDFEGPLDLLLSLIEKRKLFINDISLAKVADDYIEHIRSLSSLPVKDTAHFLLVASTLVLIKSKSLLPNLTLTEEERGDIENLEIRLKIYQEIREVSMSIKERFGKTIIFPKQQSKYLKPIFTPDKETTVQGLQDAIDRVVSQLPKKEVIPETVVRKVVSLEEMIDDLSNRMTECISMSFSDFSRIGREDKMHVAVSFLAMLELVKQGIVDVAQRGNFEDINIESRAVITPRYN